MKKTKRNLIAIVSLSLAGFLFSMTMTVPPGLLEWSAAIAEAQKATGSEGVPSSAASTAQDIEAAMKAAAAPAVQERGVGAAERVPLILERSVQFQTTEGQPVILRGGSYLVEVTAASPLKLVREGQSEPWSISARIGSHQEKLTNPTAHSFAGPNEDEHHLVLLLPDGKTVDATGSYSDVATRAFDAFTPAAISQALSRHASSGQTLKARPLPQKTTKSLYYQGLFRDRVVVKFKEGAAVRIVTLGQSLKPDLSLAPALIDPELRGRMQRQNLTEALVQTDLARVNAILQRPAVKKAAPLFSRAESFFRNERTEAEARSGQEQADLGNYFSISLEPGTKGEEVVDELNALSSVEIAYLAPIPVDAQVDVAPTTPSLQPNQGYLNAAPQGIDAQYAWTQPGGRGNGIRVIDIERNWFLTHEDLSPPFTSDGVIGSDSDHGTAVLGEMVASNRGYGVTGIASDARHGVVSVARPDGDYSVAEALNVAAGRLSRGDVILIEQHSRGPASGLRCTCNCGQFEYVAMEYWQAEFDAIQAATSRGIIVVEAAGNGSMDLDAARYGNRFNRTVRDSGALLVGASDGALRPACWTNRGSRVDVHGWGNNVWSTGYGRPDPQNRINGGDRRQWYTNAFSGTSSASPIVTGAVLSLMGILRVAGMEGMDPIQLRTLLRNTGTPQQNLAGGQIGPLPNLRNAIGQLPLQDCVGLNPNNVAAQRIRDRWKVVEGSHWILDYGNDQSAAERARDTIRHYGMTAQCFIGRPIASMMYWKAGTRTPSGAFAGEDCLAIDPTRLRVQQVAGRWKIVEGSAYVLDFEDKEHEARAALSIIQRNGYRYHCFVKRPHSSMRYWRQ